MTNEECLQILNQTKFDLMVPISPKSTPIFYSSILIALRQYWSDGKETKTACTDGKGIWFNRTWFCNLQRKQRVGLLAHELLHVAHRHIDMFCLYNMHVYSDYIEHKLWNKAGDYVINYELINAGYELPPHGLLDSKFDGMATFEVYTLLHDEYAKNQAILNDYDTDVVFIQVIDDESRKELVRLQGNITNIIANAVMASNVAGESKGSIPGDITRQLEKVVNPRLPFEKILINYVSERYGSDEVSFAKPNRRYLPDLYLPSASIGKQIDNLACIFDLSGSITEKMASSFYAAIRMIIEQFDPDLIQLLGFDTNISMQATITNITDLDKIKFIGGGNTNIQPVLEWISKNQPKVSLIFTDGWFNKPDFTNVKTDIIWIIYNHSNWKSEYGKIFYYNLKE